MPIRRVRVAECILSQEAVVSFKDFTCGLLKATISNVQKGFKWQSSRCTWSPQQSFATPRTPVLSLSTAQLTDRGIERFLSRGFKRTFYDLWKASASRTSHGCFWSTECDCFKTTVRELQGVKQLSAVPGERKAPAAHHSAETLTLVART